MKLRRLRHTLGDAEVAALAAAAYGFVGADLAALCEEAALAALRRAVAAKRAGRPLTVLEVRVWPLWGSLCVWTPWGATPACQDTCRPSWAPL